MQFLVFFTVLFIYCRTSAVLKVEVNEGTGEYVLKLNGKDWLESAATGFVYNHEWFSDDGSLGKSKKTISVVNSEHTTGTDQLGNFEKITLEWKADAGNIGGFFTYFKAYETLSSTVIFGQHVNSPFVNMSLGDNNDVVTSFPSFKVTELIGKRNYMTFESTFCPESIGKWNEYSQYKGGYLAGPLVLYDEHLTGTIISPFSNFMVGYQVRNSKSIKHHLACGVGGKVNEVPPDFSHETVIYADEGISQMFKGWGDILLERFGKRRITYDDDVFIKYLNYYTEEGKNYEDTILDEVNSLIHTQNLPIKGIQYDSWWYYKGPHGGLQLWEPRDDVFPNGMEYLNQKVNLPVTLHNRWFIRGCDYEKNFTFHVDPSSSVSLPENQDVYDHIMKKAVDWGMTCYEQDWLSKTYSEMEILQADLTVGRDWFRHMYQAAKDLQLTFQLCMPYPLHMMQTLEHSGATFTHARASDDYNPRRMQWPVAYTSLFYYLGLGLIPFKDNFWSTSATQEGCKYTICDELNPVLQTVVAVLSGGPVSPSDKIGMANAELLMETCRSDGMILKPDRPALPVDEVFRLGLLQDVRPVQVWSTLNCFSASDGLGGCWYYVFGANLVEEFVFTIDMLPFDGIETIRQYYAIRYEPHKKKLELFPFDKNNELVVPVGYHPVSEKVGWTLYQIAPQIKSCHWNFLTEMNKVISAAKERIVSFGECSSLQDDFTMVIKGVHNEVVTLAMLETGGMNIEYVECTIPAAGTATLTCNHDCDCK